MVRDPNSEAEEKGGSPQPSLNVTLSGGTRKLFDLIDTEAIEHCCNSMEKVSATVLKTEQVVCVRGQSICGFTVQRGGRWGPWIYSWLDCCDGRSPLFQ